MMENVQIATTGIAHMPILRGLGRYGAAKLYIFSLKDETSRNMVKAILDHAQDVLKVDCIVEYVDQYDIPSLVRKIRGIIQREHEENNKIYVNISGGRKTGAFAAFLAASLEGSKVDTVFYITEETNEVIEIPFLRYDLATQLISQEKREILLKVKEKGEISAKVLAQLMGKSIPIIHQHLREMEETKLIKSRKVGREKVFSLAPSGEILIP